MHTRNFYVYTTIMMQQYYLSLYRVVLLCTVFLSFMVENTCKNAAILWINPIAMP